MKPEPERLPPPPAHAGGGSGWGARWIALVVVAACGGGAKQVAAPPLPGDDKKVVRAAPEITGDPWKGRTDLIKPPARATPGPLPMPPVARFTLGNGLRVLVVPAKDLPIVSFGLSLPAGTAEDPRGKRGLAEFAARMLSKGTRRLSADRISQTIDFVGGQLQADASLEATTVTCSVLAKDLETCLALLGEVLVVPTFPQAEMPAIANELLTEVRQQRDSAEALATAHFENALWGEAHPRGWPVTEATVQAIARKDLVAWHKARFVPNAGILVVAGDVDPAALEKQLGKSFAAWKRGAAPAGKAPPEPKVTGVQVRLVDKPDQTQSHIFVGHLGPAHKDPSFIPSLVANHVLGGGILTSRLSRAVRSREGKSYSVASGFQQTRLRGAFRVATATRSDETAATLAILLREVARMEQEGPTADELADAQMALAGGYAGDFETASDIAAALLAAELHQLGEDWVREFPVRVAAVTQEQAKEAGARLLSVTDMIVVIVGNAEVVAPQLDKAGLAYERVGHLEPIAKSDRTASAAIKAAPLDPKKTAAGKKLLDAALAAKGGEAKLRAVKSLKAMGKVQLQLGGQKLDGTWTRFYLAPDQLRTDLAIPQANVQLTVVVTAKQVWQALGGKVNEMPADLAREAQKGLWRDRDFILLRHLERGTMVQAAGQVNAGGKAYDVVVLRDASGENETRVFLDGATRRLARIEYQEGGNKGFEEYDDYRQVSGLWFAFRQRAQGGQQRFDVTLDQVEVNAPIEPSVFVVPR